ncbi:MAG: F-box protein [Parachlamydiales bacterium]
MGEITEVCRQPKETWLQIFQYLSGVGDRVALMRSCKSLCDWGKADVVWKEIFFQRYPFAKRENDFYQGLVEGKAAVETLLEKGELHQKCEGYTANVIQIPSGYAALQNKISLFRRGQTKTDLLQVIQCLPDHPPATKGIVGAHNGILYHWTGEQPNSWQNLRNPPKLALFQTDEITTAAYIDSQGALLMRPLAQGLKATKITETVHAVSLGNAGLEGAPLWVNYKGGTSYSYIEFFDPRSRAKGSYPQIDFNDYGGQWLCTPEEQKAAGPAFEEIHSIQSVGRGGDLRLVVVRSDWKLTKALVFSPGQKKWNFEAGFWLRQPKAQLTEEGLLFVAKDGKLKSWRWGAHYPHPLPLPEGIAIDDFALISAGSGLGLVATWGQECKRRAFIGQLAPFKIIRELRFEIYSPMGFLHVRPIVDPTHPLLAFYGGGVDLFVLGEDGTVEEPQIPPPPPPEATASNKAAVFAAAIGVLALLYLGRTLYRRGLRMTI